MIQPWPNLSSVRKVKGRVGWGEVLPFLLPPDPYLTNKIMNRPDKDRYFMNIAWAASMRGTCKRLQVGAVLVADGYIVSTGYNGSAPGMPHCIDAPKGCLIHSGHCIRTIHAELNAFLHAQGRGDTLYCTHQPCLNCVKAAISFGVRRIVFEFPYTDDALGAYLTRDGQPFQWERLPGVNEA